jgi:hypothetical protein
MGKRGLVRHRKTNAEVRVAEARQASKPRPDPRAVRGGAMFADLETL